MEQATRAASSSRPEAQHNLLLSLSIVSFGSGFTSPERGEAEGYRAGAALSSPPSGPQVLSDEAASRVTPEAQLPEREAPQVGGSHPEGAILLPASPPEAPAEESVDGACIAGVGRRYWRSRAVLAGR